MFIALFMIPHEYKDMGKYNNNYSFGKRRDTAWMSVCGKQLLEWWFSAGVWDNLSYIAYSILL